MALVSACYEMDLARYIKERKAETPEITQHIMKCLVGGLLHMHRCGLIHNDMKPCNVFLNGAEGAEASISRSKGTRLAHCLLHLPEAMHVVIGDLGLALPGDPRDRRLRSDNDVQRNGVPEGTMWYRAPEILLGCASFSFGVDVWALGCLGGELFSGAPLFPGNAAIITLYKIWQVFGTPTSGSLLSMPLFPKKPPSLKAQDWPFVFKPNAPGQRWPQNLAKFLHEALRMAPEDRITMEGSLRHDLFQPPSALSSRNKARPPLSKARWIHGCCSGCRLIQPGIVTRQAFVGWASASEPNNA